MKTLKLEAGKTYRNRKGEEVKIVSKGNATYPYIGSNGIWYAENGRWDYDTETNHDLIAEVSSEPTRHTFGLVPEALTAIRYTFDIPDGMKKGTVSQEGNRIVVEMVPEERKESKLGDVSRSANTDAMQMSEQNTKITELEDKIWSIVHNWCDEQSSEIPDQNRRYLMDGIKALVLSHVSKSLPIKKYDIDFDGQVLAGIDISENTPKIFGAINGYGDDISIEKIKITER